MGEKPNPAMLLEAMEETTNPCENAGQTRDAGRESVSMGEYSKGVLA
jgi:hypothetical protein